MGPYAHFTLAAKLEAYLQPKQAGAYYWGAIIPDIRYLTHIRRDHTHVGQDCLKRWLACYPHLESFLLGYQVHCLIDQVNFAPWLSTAFPLNLLKLIRCKAFSPAQMTMLVEMHYLQSATSTRKLAGNHNEVLDDLGITPEQTRVYAQAMQDYIDAHSLDAAIAAFQKIGLLENTRLDKYMNVYEAMKNKKLISAIFNLSVKNARLDQRVIHQVKLRIDSPTALSQSKARQSA